MPSVFAFSTLAPPSSTSIRTTAMCFFVAAHSSGVQPCCHSVTLSYSYLIVALVDHLSKVRELRDLVQRLNVPRKRHMMKQCHLVTACLRYELRPRGDSLEQLPHLSVLTRFVCRKDSLALER